MKTFNRVFSLIITILVCTALFGQNPIEKSDKLIFIFGKKYYLHEVKKGQTLFSISNAYNVEVQDIITENSALANDKLKVGMEIKIPANDGQANGVSKSTNKYIEHIVEKKQTLYFLCKKYNVDEAELVRLNPEIVNGLKVGQIIKVPQPGSEPINLNKDYNFYTVQPDETIFSLAQRFGIEISTLKSENPEIQNNQLKTGQVIKIPKADNYSLGVIKTTPVNNEVPVSNNFDALYFEEAGVTPCNEFKYNNNIKFKVAVILPLFIQENLALKNSGSYYSEKNKNSGRFYEFYNGLLLAAKKMKESDVSIEFYIKDERASASATREILAQSEMKDMDLIIGPVYSENFKLASEFAKQNKINIVSPFKLADNSVVKYNPFVFVTNPDDETEIGNISKYLSNSYSKSIVMITNGTEDEQKSIAIFKNKLVNSGSSSDIVFKQVDYKIGGIGAVEDALSVGMENIIIVPSKDEVFITNVATKLNYLTKKYSITIFGMQSWEQFRNIELEYLKNLKFHYATTNFIDKENKAVKNFDFQYKAYFKNDPSIYAYLGYDVASYFLNELKNHGKLFQFCISNSNEQSYNTGLRFDFNFERLSAVSGFENNWIGIVKIDEDFNLVKVK